MTLFGVGDQAQCHTVQPASTRVNEPCSRKLGYKRLDVPDEENCSPLQIISRPLLQPLPPSQLAMKYAFASLALVAAVSASPIIERQAKSAVLPLRHVNNAKSAKGLVASGKARINKINGVESQSVGPHPDASSGSVTNEDVTYVAPVSIGGNTWDLIVDTGCMSCTYRFAIIQD